MEGGSGHPREAIDTIPAEVKKYFFQDRQPPNLVTDYDAIGFDADHCFVKYNIRELVAFLVKIELDEFVELGYPKSLAEGFNYETDLAMCMNASIFDIDNGLVIKLAEGKEVVQAIKGLRKLNRDEIQAVYGNPPLYDAYQWPNTTHLQKGKGAYWVFMTYFDTPKIAVVLRAIDLIDKGVMKGKTYYDVAMDLRTMVYRNYVHYNDKEVFPIATYGKYFIEIINDPKKYIQYQPELRTSLTKLKKAGKKIFLGTNSHTEYSNVIMTATLGDDWRQFFDVVCCYCRKPLFFWDQKPSPFYTYDPSSKMLRGQQLFHGEEMSDRPGEIYTEGNSKTLTNYFKRLLKLSHDQELRVAFFGD
jgi:HAD superfamily 5'-nucleotidase-like hydrolase